MKEYISLLLAVCVLLCLCACGAAGQSPVSAADEGETPSAAVTTELPPSPASVEPSSPAAETAASAEETPVPIPEPTTHEQPTVQAYSDEAQISISLLRGDVDEAGAIFGVAYIGSYFPGGTDYDEWFSSAAAALIAEYPFVSEIDAAHTVGSSGHLYCILARDYSTAITAQTSGGEVLYRAENGEPILIFCSRDGEGMLADTVITFSTAQGAVYQWSPRLDGMNYPELLIGAERQLLSWDFTCTFNTGFELTGWFNEGWLGPTELGLAGADVFEGMSWCIRTTDGTDVGYRLSFYPNAARAYDGEVGLECFYGGDTAVQARWEGWWYLDTTPDNASVLHIDMMLMDGADAGAYEGASVISENYLVLISPSGERLLLVAEDEFPVLPLFPDGWRFGELSLAAG